MNIMETIIISGGSGGIGKMIAEGLSSYELILIARKPEELAKAQTELGPHVKTVACDITDEKKLQTELAKHDLSKLKAIINCAGRMIPLGRFHECDLATWKQTIDINLNGTATLCHATMPTLLKNKRGKIINLSGGGSAYPFPMHTAYGSSKAAVVRFTETLAKEYPELDINVIAPGAHNTAIWKQETYKEPPREWADPKRLTALIAFLLTTDGISGKFLHINDKWEDLTPTINNSDLFTLRRIENR